MTTAMWCVLVSVLLPYVLAGAGAYFRVKQLGHFDNHHPRAQLAQLESAGARLWAAQQNAWEALIAFTAAVAVAHLAGVGPEASATPALVFVAARILHPILYVADLATLRSVVFVVGFGATLWLFGLAASV